MSAARAAATSLAGTSVKAAAGKNSPGRGSAGAAGSSAGGTGSQQRQFVAAQKGSRSEAESSFERLRTLDKGESSGDAIGVKGLQQLLNELGISAESLEMYTLLWRLGATRNGSISRSEWLVAMYTYNIEYLTQLRSKVTEWTADVRQNRGNAFGLMYVFVYDYIRGEVDRQMSSKAAADAWRVLFQNLDSSLVQSWREWVTTQYDRPLSRDLWRQAWVYLSSLKTADGAAVPHDKDKWPTAVDDFAEWRRRKVAPNVQ